MDEVPEPIRRVVQAWTEAGRPPQPPTAWPRQKWIDAFPSVDLSSLPAELDRAAVAAACVGAAASDRGALFGFLAVMAWGFGEKGYGPHRTGEILRQAPEAASRLRAIARAVADEAVAGYRALATYASLKGLGTSFGTKFLYFAQPCECRPRALILDDFVASWLRRELGWRIDTSVFSAKAYEEYVLRMQGWAIQLGIAAHELEMCIFRDEASRRGSRWGGTTLPRPRAEPAVGSLPFDAYPDGGRALLGKPKWGDGTARRSYGVKSLEWCGHRCAYCGLDMSTFEGWLQLSVDHVIPQQMQGAGYPPEWVLDAINVVAACGACNGYFNRDPVIGEVPATLLAFCELRDRVFRERRARILERRGAERAWFESHIRPARP